VIFYQSDSAVPDNIYRPFGGRKVTKVTVDVPLVIGIGVLSVAFAAICVIAFGAALTLGRGRKKRLMDEPIDLDCDCLTQGRVCEECWGRIRSLFPPEQFTLQSSFETSCVSGEYALHVFAKRSYLKVVVEFKRGDATIVYLDESNAEYAPMTLGGARITANCLRLAAECGCDRIVVSSYLPKL
jgi:hypothetical protein